MSEIHERPLVYRLYAVLVHYGRSSHSGHYFCYIKVLVLLYITNWYWLSLINSTSNRKLVRAAVFTQGSTFIHLVVTRCAQISRQLWHRGSKVSANLSCSTANSEKFRFFPETFMFVWFFLFSFLFFWGFFFFFLVIVSFFFPEYMFSVCSGSFAEDLITWSCPRAAVPFQQCAHTRNCGWSAASWQQQQHARSSTATPLSSVSRERFLSLSLFPPLF